MGAAIVLRLAARTRKRIAGVVLVDNSPTRIAETFLQIHAGFQSALRVYRSIAEYIERLSVDRPLVNSDLLRHIAEFLVAAGCARRVRIEARPCHVERFREMGRNQIRGMDVAGENPLLGSHRPWLRIGRSVPARRRTHGLRPVAGADAGSQSSRARGYARQSRRLRRCGATVHSIDVDREAVTRNIRRRAAVAIEATGGTEIRCNFHLLCIGFDRDMPAALLHKQELGIRLVLSSLPREKPEDKQLEIGLREKDRQI